MALKAKFTTGRGAMAFDCIEYHIYDENYTYFSMVPYNQNECIHGETILRASYSMGGQYVRIVDSIPDEIEDYTKWSEDGVLESGTGIASLKDK